MASQKSFPSQEDERLVNFGITGEQSLIPKLQCFSSNTSEAPTKSGQQHPVLGKLASVQKDHGKL